SRKGLTGACRGAIMPRSVKRVTRTGARNGPDVSPVGVLPLWRDRTEARRDDRRVQPEVQARRELDHDARGPRPRLLAVWDLEPVPGPRRPRPLARRAIGAAGLAADAGPPHND